MKKFKCFFAVMLTLAMAVHLSSMCFANTVEESQMGSVYIYSEECSIGIMDYALNSYARLAKGYIDGNSLNDVQMISLGNPFTIENTNNPGVVYYFPLRSERRVFATLCVYTDFGQSNSSESPIYTGFVSEFMVEELNALSLQNKPLYIRLRHSDDGLEAENATTCSTTEVCVNISSQLAATTYEESQVEVKTLYRKYLALSIIETQGGNNWCSPYSCAAILRFLNGSTTTPTAWSLLNLVYDNPTAQSNFNVNEVFYVAHYYGYYPTRFVGKLSDSLIKTDIDNNRPIFVALSTYDNDTETKGSNHAMVLRGYDDFIGVYSFWNPWYSTYVSMDQSSTQIYDANANCTFTWNDCFYDWCD